MRLRGVQRQAARGRDVGGRAEFDVVGLKLKEETVFLCEVTTHLGGLLYVTSEKTKQRVKAKLDRQKAYARDHLGHFKTVRFMLWSPVVRSEKVKVALKRLQEREALEPIFNDEYTRRIEILKSLAKKETRDTGNPFFRALQLIEHLR